MRHLAATCVAVTRAGRRSATALEEEEQEEEQEDPATLAVAGMTAA